MNTNLNDTFSTYWKTDYKRPDPATSAKEKETNQSEAWLELQKVIKQKAKEKWSLTE
ncbi:hypothetical protein AJ85_17390 [Alkalihalobacillus alcalophilus ATCC 27647 = CGMCC 1.3604]|uniref:Uncharacterized protein n=1 Tax=Alkalihalobacillus alcalophilus ATCC 27647 = CGMCC 1.3604 TaxID=1218173 RepID=A0A4S4JWF2_ALKAL|nr:hypothetical protein [Alkalihalobacillus alcalophilus]MED1562090.1 hypothetical protein [Alkalihalobacillus alcalophilus]THG89491.1 hypothetical protein AJ85_17390 [Alkalihalobacillus alcalophilus ATCC 27647 = CGMCC 1.3604]